MKIIILSLLFLTGCVVNTPSERNLKAKIKFEDPRYPAKCKRLKNTVVLYRPDRDEEDRYHHHTQGAWRYVCKDVGACYLKVGAGRGAYAVPLPLSRCKEEGL